MVLILNSRTQKMQPHKRYKPHKVSYLFTLPLEVEIFYSFNYLIYNAICFKARILPYK